MTAHASIEAKGKVNGVDVGKLEGTIEAVKASPDLARFRFRARNEWLGGGHNRSRIKEFYGAGEEDASRTEPFVLEADEPPVLLGEDRGANPVEFVLHALAACMTTSLIYHAAARGIRIESVESRLEGDLDLRGFFGLSTEVPKGYQGIRATFRVRADAPAAEIEKLCRMSPVLDTISRPVPVDVRVEPK